LAAPVTTSSNRPSAARISRGAQGDGLLGHRRRAAPPKARGVLLPGGRAEAAGNGTGRRAEQGGSLKPTCPLLPRPSSCRSMPPAAATRRPHSARASAGRIGRQAIGQLQLAPGDNPQGHPPAAPGSCRREGAGIFRPQAHVFIQVEAAPARQQGAALRHRSAASRRRSAATPAASCGRWPGQGWRHPAGPGAGHPPPALATRAASGSTCRPAGARAARVIKGKRSGPAPVAGSSLAQGQPSLPGGCRGAAGCRGRECRRIAA
jgi:hypothetical protein